MEPQVWIPNKLCTLEFPLGVMAEKRSVALAKRLIKHGKLKNPLYMHVSFAKIDQRNGWFPANHFWGYPASTDQARCSSQRSAWLIWLPHWPSLNHFLAIKFSKKWKKLDPIWTSLCFFEFLRQWCLVAQLLPGLSGYRGDEAESQGRPGDGWCGTHWQVTL